MNQQRGRGVLFVLHLNRPGYHAQRPAAPGVACGCGPDRNPPRRMNLCDMSRISTRERCSLLLTDVVLSAKTWLSARAAHMVRQITLCLSVHGSLSMWSLCADATRRLEREGWHLVHSRQGRLCVASWCPMSCPLRLASTLSLNWFTSTMVSTFVPCVRTPDGAAPQRTVARLCHRALRPYLSVPQGPPLGHESLRSRRRLPGLFCFQRLALLLLALLLVRL